MNSEAIIETLSIDEKIRLLSGVGNWHTYDCNGKLPKRMMTDGPHGLRKQENEGMGDLNQSNRATCFPTASAIACSWDPKQVAKMAKGIAKEAKAENVSIVLGCGVNMKRSPLCGRNFEYFSEDPFLAGTLATSYINSMQQDGVGTSLKHFAGNSQETRRQTSNSQIDERALREIYLTAFEMAVKNAQPTTVMASYNRLNGEYACANKWLLTDVLRNEWGFKGAIVTDWGAMVDAPKCLKAGTDLEMPDSLGYHTRKLKEALEKGEIEQKDIDDACRRVIDNIVSLKEGNQSSEPIDFYVQKEVARDLENSSAVLLKNNGILPIDKKEKILIIGDLAVHMRYQGAGSSHINTGDVMSAVAAMKAKGYEVQYVEGYNNDSREPNPLLEKEALQICSTNQKVLFFCGLTDRFEGEGYDRTSLNLPECQTSLLSKICEKSNQVVAVTFGGAPFDMSFINKVQAILHMYLGGQAVGESCADLISGDVTPSGKLAETFPLELRDVPSTPCFAPKHDDVQYRESIFVGYRYYETYHIPVQFEFGYGLSYTEFRYSDLALDQSEYGNSPLHISYSIENVGQYTGEEISQVYVINPQGKLLRPYIELRGFNKTRLQPGEKRKVEAVLTDRAFSIYNVSHHRFEVMEGDYKIAIGASVRDLKLTADIHVSGQKYDADDSVRLPEFYQENKHGMDISEDTFKILYNKPLSRFRDIKRGEFTLGQSFQDVSSQSIFGRIMMFIADRLVASMCKGKAKDDPAAMMVIMGVKEGSLESLISNSNGMISYKLIEALVLFANRKRMQGVKKLFERNKTK